MKLQLKNLKKNYLSAQKYFKKKKLKNFCVTITTNTSNGEKKTYLPPLREIGKTLIFGVVVYSTEQLKKFAKFLIIQLMQFLSTQKKNSFFSWKKI